MPNKKNKNLIVILISILGVLVVFGIFGYKYWENNTEMKLEKEQGAQGEITREGKEIGQLEDNNKKQGITDGTEESTDNTEEKDGTELKEVEEKTKNWQIYKNTFYNYNLKYPPTWYEGPENKEDAWIVYFMNNKVDKIKDIDLIEGAKVEILVQGNPRKLSLEDWAREGHIFSGEPKSSKKIKVGGVEAIKEEADSEGMSLTIFFFKGDDVYTISYSGAEADYNKYKGDFDLMINSFKFEK